MGGMHGESDSPGLAGTGEAGVAPLGERTWKLPDLS
jgi:hypothetical protein